jgi:hypothetical protein
VRALLVAAILTASAPAARADQALRAQQIPEKARQLAERGRVLHEAGNYGDAIAAFREAYVLAPSPGLLFNLAQSYRLAGRCDDAAWMYRRYLDSRPSGDRRSLAEAHLATVEKCGHGGLRVAIIPTALETPLPEPPRLHPPGITAPLAGSLAASARDTGEREERLGIAIGIGGAVLLAGAAWFAWQAHEDSDAVSVASQQGQRDSATAEGFGIAGGIAVVSGAVIYAMGRHHDAQHLQVAPTRGGAGARLSWRF